MLRLFTAASLAAGVLVAPGAAWAADTTTSLTSAEMYAALKSVAGTTAPAEINGYGGDFSVTASLSGATQTGSALFAADPATGLGYYTTTGTAVGGTGGGYGAAGKGDYHYLDDPTTRAAAKMAGYASAKYVFAADSKLTLDSWAGENLPAPSSMVVSDPRHAGTKVAHDDGTTDYSYVDDDKMTWTFTVNTAGAVTAGKMSGSGLEDTFRYNYGPQTITLPAGDQVIAQATLMKAMAYLTMAADVKRVATTAAKTTEKKAAGKTVTVSAVRKYAASEASAYNRNAEFKVIAVTNIKGGAHVSAKNPFTKVSVSYTIKAAGKHAVVTKG
ncbi:hypothetical protein ACWT_1899 [Actinoplanes sp. SE50]|uniref:hypothetical protein n=1 Tax=unclassified Actinoplanes TaxID=2626549 RepID=UPI00023EBCFC|nr:MULTISPECIES: hypothetical protein [unclassified Actinoplanes]AEV82918.1 hypothetical protein ACPL_2021 [Actinoplanes sp. SE50/110]ATO81314.1 hypothetical protein ACWT_1899 [Actinoplanes sp. SE50]SLL98721.1 hypothetical protein ACSP50_1948 [Actinoplanes sp. SE50/110]